MVGVDPTPTTLTIKSARPGAAAHAAAGIRTVTLRGLLYLYEEPNEELAFLDTDETEPGDGGAALAVHVFNP